MRRGFLFCISFSFLSISALILPDDYSPVCNCNEEFKITDHTIKELRNAGPQTLMKQLLKDDITSISLVAKRFGLSAKDVWRGLCHQKRRDRRFSLDDAQLRFLLVNWADYAFKTRASNRTYDRKKRWVLYHMNAVTASAAKFQMIAPCPILNPPGKSLSV